MRDYLIPVFKKIFTGSADDFASLMLESMKEGKKEFVVTANPEILIKAESENDLQRLLLEKGVSIVPDGISVVKALQKNGYSAKERITGVDLCERLLEAAGEGGMSVYLLGAKEEIVRTLAENLKNAYPGITVNYHNGYDGNKDDIMNEIKKAEPDLILVALGVPNQERLIYKHIADFTKGVFIGVGGSFDTLSGHKKRAPSFFIKTNTEWLYRIAKEPSRLKRFYENNVKFMRYV